MTLEVLTDRSGLRDIRRKVEREERLTHEDGLALYATTDVAALGELADFANRRLNGLRVGYNVNRHINYSNVCKLACMFCAFAKKHGDDGAYEFSMDEILERSREAWAAGADELHIVGGLHPDYPYEYYPAMLRAIKERYPELHLKGFTAVEIDYFAELSGKSIEEVLAELVDAGLGSMPGGGAEILTDRVWKKIYRDKMGPDKWIDVIGRAHRAGVKTNSTMLHGHIETVDEKVTHMLRLRELQDETGGFMTFIPLRFHPENTPIRKLGIVHGVSSVREIAVGRLLLDNIPHVKTYWIMTSLEVAQICLTMGADDIDGTVVEEKITHMAGARTPEHVTEEDLRRCIEEAGRVPYRRDTLYNELPYPVAHAVLSPPPDVACDVGSCPRPGKLARLVVGPGPGGCMARAHRALLTGLPVCVLPVCVLTVCLLGASALADEPRRDLAPGSRAKGELTAGETHLYVAPMVKGTAYSAKLTGKRGFVPRLEILDPTRAPIDPGAALTTAGPKTLLQSWTVPATQIYLLRVSGDAAGGGAGAYSLATKGKPVRGRAQTARIDDPTGTVTLEIDVAAGATLVVSAKRARGSAAEPDILGVTGPDGTPLDLQRRKTSAKRASCRATAPASGPCRITFGTANGTVGELLLKIKVKTLRLPRARHKVRPGDAVPDFAFFAARVQPVFQARGCNSSACHGAAIGQGRMILRGPATGSFSLEQTYWNYFQLAQWVTPGDERSRAILKPLFIADGGMFHGGGDVFRKQDAEYRQFVDWATGSALPSIPPTAVAGADADGVVGITLALDGTESFDLENDPLTYEWTLATAPTGSAAALDDATNPKPLFTPDRSGAYLFELRVSDPSGETSAADQVVVSAEPSARADVITFEAEHAALTGDFTVATDPDASGGEFVTSPPGPAATGTATWTFTIDEAGDFALWGRALATSNGADALRIRIDGGAESTWEATPHGAWTFERTNDGRDRRDALAGTSSLEAAPAGRELRLAADGTETFAVVTTNMRLGTDGTLAATLRHPTDASRRNGYVAFDLVDARNFLFAGLDGDSGAVEVGRVVNGQIAVVRQVGTHLPAAGTATDLSVTWDADGNVQAHVDGRAQQPYRFDPADTTIRGGLTGVAVRRVDGQDGAGRFDDVRVTDAGGDLHVDDFESDATWTDPLTFSIAPGAHQLHVLADEGGVALDRLVLAPADLSPTDVVGEMRILRRLYFDTVNRSPTDDELLLAPFLGADDLAGALTRGYAYALAWYEAQLEKLGLVGRLEPLPTDKDFDTLSSIPARLANGEITELDALAEIALSEAWDRQNLVSKDAVYGIFEEFLGREPITARPDGTGLSEYSAARRLQEGRAEHLFGIRVSGSTALVRLVLGLDGQRPDYNHHVVEGEPDYGVADFDALHREQILQAWRRVAGETPPDPASLADWTTRYAADASVLRDLVTEMLRSSAYVEATRTPRVKTDLQFVRGLFMDLLGERPDAQTVSLLNHAYAASGDEAPVNAQLVIQLLRSDAAAAAAPPVAQVQVDAWVSDAFVRFFGREPSPAELAGFRADLNDPTYADTAWALEALLTSDEYRTY